MFAVDRSTESFTAANREHPSPFTLNSVTMREAGLVTSLDAMTTEASMTSDEAMTFGMAHLMGDYRVQVVTYGYVMPLLTAAVVVTNTVAGVVLTGRAMRSPTHCLLAALAFSSILTVLAPLVPSIYFYTLGHSAEWTPHGWCKALDWLVEFLPITLRTKSTWLTVALAAHRYVGECRPASRFRLRTTAGVVKLVLVVYVLAIGLHVCRLFSTHIPVEQQSLVTPNTTVTGCLRVYSQYELSGFLIFYFFFSVVFTLVAPAISLVVIGARLICALRTAQARCRLVSRDDRSSVEWRRLDENVRTTLVVILVVGVYIMSDIPHLILIIVYILPQSRFYHLVVVVAMIHLFVQISYIANCCIYYVVSRQFRDNIKQLLPSTQHQEEYLINPAESDADERENAGETPI